VSRTCQLQFPKKSHKSLPKPLFFEEHDPGEEFEECSTDQGGDICSYVERGLGDNRFSLAYAFVVVLGF
jgi:hypothetical protein